MAMPGANQKPAERRLEPDRESAHGPVGSYESKLEAGTYDYCDQIQDELGTALGGPMRTLGSAQKARLRPSGSHEPQVINGGRGPV